MGIKTDGNVIFKWADGSKVVHVYRQRINDRKDLGVIDSRDNFNSGSEEITHTEQKAISDFLVNRAEA